MSAVHWLLLIINDVSVIGISPTFRLTTWSDTSQLWFVLTRMVKPMIHASHLSLRHSLKILTHSQIPNLQHCPEGFLGLLYSALSTTKRKSNKNHKKAFPYAFLCPNKLLSTKISIYPGFETCHLSIPTRSHQSGKPSKPLNAIPVLSKYPQKSS